MDCTNDSQSDQEDSSLEVDGYESTDIADQNMNVLTDGIIHVYCGKYGGVQLALNGHLYTRDRTRKLIQIQHESDCKIIQQDSGTLKPKKVKKKMRQREERILLIVSEYTEGSDADSYLRRLSYLCNEDSR